MRGKKYRKRHRWNVARIFGVTLLFLAVLGFIVTQRGHNARQAESGGSSDESTLMERILSEKGRYP